MIFMFQVVHPEKVSAQDGFMASNVTTGSGTFSFGIQPVLFTQTKSDYMLFLRAGYGLSAGTDLEFKAGFQDDTVYLGGHLQYSLPVVHSFPMHFSFQLGGYHMDHPGGKAGFITAFMIDTFVLYTGVNYKPMFLDDDEMLHPVTMPVGVHIPLTTASGSFFFETNLGLNDEGERFDSLSLGLRIYL